MSTVLLALQIFGGIAIAGTVFIGVLYLYIIFMQEVFDASEGVTCILVPFLAAGMAISFLIAIDIENEQVEEETQIERCE